MSQLLEIARFLEKNDDIIKISNIEDLAETGSMFISFCGHFSAGKSNLINNILGKGILPVKMLPSTAVVTYIRYGEVDNAVIYFEDGTSQSIEIEGLNTVFQDSENIDISNIHYIDVFCNIDFLQNGMVLVDTPGVNTVIQKHIDIVSEAYQKSHKIIYVLGSPMNDVDRKFMKDIDDCGIDIIAVRTKCDLFNEDEEDPDLALMDEEMTISKVMEQNLEFYPVSNQSNSNYFANIQNINRVLFDLSINVKEEVAVICNKQLSIYKERYLVELKEKLKDLQDVVSGNNENIDEKINECNRKIDLLQGQFDSKVSKIKAQLKEDEKNAVNGVSLIVKNSVSNFEDNALLIKSDLENNINNLYKETIDTSVYKCIQCINEYLDEIVENEVDIINNVHVNYDKIPLSYSDAVVENSVKLNNYREQLQTMLEEVKQAKENTYGDLEPVDYDDAIREIEDQLRDIPTDIATNIKMPEGVQPSQMFKMAGSVVDAALFFLPGTVVAKGVGVVANSSKIANVLKKTGSVGKVVMNIGSQVGKHANLIDKTRDVASMLNAGAKRKRKLERELSDAVNEKFVDVYDDMKMKKQEEGTIFDKLNVSYWTEKLGKNFDTASVETIDHIEMKNRETLKNELMRQHNDIINKKIKQKQEYGLIESEKARQELEAKYKMEEAETIQRKMKQEENKLKEQARKEQTTQYIKEYKKQLNQQLDSISKEILATSFSAAEGNISMYISMKSSKIVASINSEKDSLEALKGNNDNVDFEQIISNCSQYIQILEGE